MTTTVIMEAVDRLQAGLFLRICPWSCGSKGILLHLAASRLGRFDQFHFAVASAVQHHHLAFGIAEHENIAVAKVGLLDGFFQSHGAQGDRIARVNQVNVRSPGDRRKLVYNDRNCGGGSNPDGSLYLFRRGFAIQFIFVNLLGVAFLLRQRVLYFTACFCKCSKASLMAEDMSLD